MKIAWLTDIHVNFLEKINRQQFYETITTAEIELIIISGDIAEAPSVCELLTEMAHAINKPIYFVLGNHDYYFGEVTVVRMSVLTQFDGHISTINDGCLALTEADKNGMLLM